MHYNQPSITACVPLFLSIIGGLLSNSASITAIISCIDGILLRAVV